MAPVNVRNVGILGLGSIGLRHARLLLAQGIAVAGYDPSPAACEALRTLGGSTASRATVIDGCDAAIIATPNDRHLADLVDTVSAGKPTLVEKPLGHDLNQARRLIDAAERQETVVAAAFNLRFRSVVACVARWLTEGAVGRPLAADFVCGSYLPDWRPAQDHSQGYAADALTGGVIFDTIHEFDLAVHLLGHARVAHATALRSGLLDIDSEDCAVIVLRHDCNALTTLRLDYLRRLPKRALEIVGSEGTVAADLRGGKATVTANDGTVVRRHSTPIERDFEYNRQLENFLAAAAAGSEPECSGRRALHSLELALAARDCAGLPSSAPEVVALRAGKDQ